MVVLREIWKKCGIRQTEFRHFLPNFSLSMGQHARDAAIALQVSAKAVIYGPGGTGRNKD